ncbi:MAG: hypothetical protein L3J22_07720 [Xanthomonadales bacterium]|nr:hypothetical protein [Xanthomonadales bacterium]
MKKKSDKQHEALRLARNKELKAVHALDPGFSCQGVVGEFIGVYIQSEVFSKKLQHYYRTDTNKSGRDQLQINTLKAALKYFNITMLETNISSLFQGGAGKRYSKSVRQLRNGYLHALSPEDQKEIMSKASMFIPKLKRFINNEIAAI